MTMSNNISLIRLNCTGGCNYTSNKAGFYSLNDMKYNEVEFDKEKFNSSICDDTDNFSNVSLAHILPKCLEIDEISCEVSGDCEKSYWALLLLVFPLLTVFGNVLVILSVVKERSLQNATNYFIVSLAIADLFVGMLVMPLGAYYLVNTSWGLPPYICDCYIGMDVICSTSSIFNLVAISVDRYIAVTKPIKYAQHKSNTRIVLTIAGVWSISITIGIPIMAGLNDEGRLPGVCAFNNAIFIILSSTFSFYIPCLIMIYLYYRIFQAIHRRALKQSSNKPRSSTATGTIIENLAQTRKLAETNVTDSTLTVPSGGQPSQIDEDRPTNNTSNSQEDDEDIETVICPENCHVIQNLRTEEADLGDLDDENCSPDMDLSEHNGKHPTQSIVFNDVDESTRPKIQTQIKSKLKKLSNRNGDVSTGAGSTSGSNPEGGVSLLEKKERKAAVARFTIYKAHKASKRKREKSSAKKERKATKTLAIVLGAFLVCWVPFFTCNILDAFHKLLDYDALDPGANAFLFTTWLGYINSFLNPVIYTIFNPEFRKAFKKILMGKS